MNLSIDLKRKKRNEVNILSVETSESGSSRRWRRSFFFFKKGGEIFYFICASRVIYSIKRG